MYIQFRMTFSLCLCLGYQPQQGGSHTPVPSHFCQLLQGDFKGFPSQLYYNRVLGLPQGLLQERRSQNSSP